MRITVDGEIALEVVDAAGPPGAPVLVAVHGFGGGLVDFVDHLPVLTQTHRVVLVDLRGHGASDAPTDPAGYGIDLFVVDVLAVVDALGIGGFRILGHSMGGVVARRLALVAPERVDALILMDTWPGAVPGFEPALVHAAALLGEAEGKDVLRAVLDAASPVEPPAVLRLRAAGPEYAARKLARWNALSLTMWVTLVREMVDLPDELDALAAITCPTLVLVGELDAAFRDPADAMAAVIPGARLAVIPGAGHEPQLEATDTWLAVLDSFFESLPVPSITET